MIYDAFGNKLHAPRIRKSMGFIKQYLRADEPETLYNLDTKPDAMLNDRIIEAGDHIIAADQIS